MADGIQEQLDAWVNGEPHHNMARDECCPDFSCCQPELLAPKDVRLEFAEATESKRHAMLGMFLGGIKNRVAGHHGELLPASEESADA